MAIGRKTIKEEINGSDLYFLKKLHVMLLIAGFLVVNTVALAGLYFTLESDVAHNKATLEESYELLQEHEERLDLKHDKILLLEQSTRRIEANLEAYMEKQGFVYVK